MILITGANGFLASSIIESKKETKFKLVSRSKSIHSQKHEFLQIDINGSCDYGRFLEGVDTIVHCAAKVHSMPQKNLIEKEDYQEINVLGTLNLAQQAVKSGVKRFIFISSIKVNGEGTVGNSLYTSQDSPQPKDPYGASKAEAELRLSKLGRKTGMEIVIIRPPLVYGEGAKANFASLMKAVERSVPLPFRLINSNRRSLVSVYNLVDLINVCIEHPKAANQIFLVSDDDDMSTAEIVSLMAKVQGKLNLNFPVPISLFKFIGKVTGKKDVVDRLVGNLAVDINHTKKTLGWKPPFSVEYGFLKCIPKK